MQGFFNLRTAGDLREKLHRDLNRLRENPLDVDLAFNFFVTAEHMRDWLYPGRAGGREREGVRAGSTLLQICSHIANGGKHFEIEDPRHTSVRDLEKQGAFFDPAFFGQDFFDPHFFGGGALVVRLDGDVARQLRESQDIIEGLRGSEWVKRGG